MDDEKVRDTCEGEGRESDRIARDERSASLAEDILIFGKVIRGGVG